MDNRVFKYLRESLSREDRDDFISAFEKMIGDKNIILSYEDGRITVRTKQRHNFIHDIKGNIEDMITIVAMLGNRGFDITVNYTGIPSRKIKKMRKQMKKYGVE